MGAFRAMSAPPLHRLKVVLPNLTFTCHKHENSGNDDKNEKSDKYESLPEAPTTCCMSGCPDCVWLDYAEKLSQIFQDGGEEAKRKIEEKVSDPNIKAFLLHELRMKKQKK